MEKFCQFEVHEYMDMYPRKEVRTFIADDESAIEKAAKEWAERMTKAYSGGPTRFIKLMNKEEAEAHIKELVDYEDKHPQEDSETFKQEMWNLFYKCY